MSRWLSECDIRVLQDYGTRPHVYLLEPLRYESDVLGTTIEVPAGVSSDLASLPDALAAPAALMQISVCTGLRAAILHDWLVRTEMPRRTADRVYSEALDACGVPAHAAQAMYMAVSVYTSMIARIRNDDDAAPIDA